MIHNDGGPIREAVDALRAAGAVLAPIGEELERRQIGDLTLSDSELWRSAASRGWVEDSTSLQPGPSRRPLHLEAPGHVRTSTRTF
ncbi:hypothetical protein [Methylobacterium fujisawaense]|jgi:hypothetical protein